MKRLIALGTLALVATVISGCIFNSDDDKEVKKGKVSGKITMSITGEPVANVKVMLVNRNAKIDTVNYANNAKAFVDSAVTGANGEFVIDGVPPGHYGVVPVNGDTTKVYKFTYAAGSDSSGFTMNGDAHSISFIAENTGYPGAWEKTLAIEVNFINTGYTIRDVTVKRRQWRSFVPEMRLIRHGLPADEDGREYAFFSCAVGYHTETFTLENYFDFTVDCWEAHSSRIVTRSFTISFSLEMTPESSTWEYDIQNDRLKCVSINGNEV